MLLVWESQGNLGYAAHDNDSITIQRYCVNRYFARYLMIHHHIWLLEKYRNHLFAVPKSYRFILECLRLAECLSVTVTTLYCVSWLSQANFSFNVHERDIWEHLSPRKVSSNHKPQLFQVFIYDRQYIVVQTEYKQVQWETTTVDF